MKSIQFKNLKLFSVVVLAMGLALTSCKNSPVTSSDEKEELSPSIEMMGEPGHDAQSSQTTTSQNVYFSDENVLTYDHINAPTVSDWTTSVCKDDGSGSIGLNDSRWTRAEDQTAYNIRPLLSGGLHAFETWWGGIHHPNNFGQAEWINSVYKRYSVEMNDDGDGHNWTRYELPVDGNGTFELKLLADNCSWIYLDDKLVGYQDDADVSSVDSIRYGVTLDGPATLTYIIYDGGGDAGGKFRLETTTEDIPEFDPPAPVGDTTPPVLSYSQETSNLWPPNHKMVLVATGISADDNVDGPTDVTVTVSSNEASNGKGDGNTNTDYEIVTHPDSSKDVYVRAERSGKNNGRTYTITMSATDTAGNNATESIEVEVAKSQKGGRR